MSDEIRQALDGYVAEAVELRFAGDIPDPQSAPKQILDTLHDVRRRLDRIEFLLGRAIRVRARTRAAGEAAKAAVDDAWDAAAQRARSGPVARGDEFSSARERHADANLAVLDLRIAARQATAVAEHADSAVELLRLFHRGLGETRYELLTVVRSYQFESNLDR